ncbi:MAG: RND transporter, partial [Planctomycetota bacterium]
MRWPDRLISARYFVAFATLVIGLFLGFSGKHAEYEQSIKSFFTEDDASIVSFEKWAGVFGYDNILFVCYDDPTYLTPAGLSRVADLTRRLKA